jgi:hypothetical protein
MINEMGCVTVRQEKNERKRISNNLLEHKLLGKRVRV